MDVGTPLKELPITINYGVKTGCNEAFIIDEKTRDALIAEDPKSAEIIASIVRGRDIKPYETHQKDNAEFVILALYGSYKYLELKYPAIYKRLICLKNTLQKRGQCTGSKAREDKPFSGAHHWLELDNCPTEDYIALFAKSKIIYPNMTSAFPFSYDETGMFGNDKTFIITEQENDGVTVNASENAKQERHCEEPQSGNAAICKLHSGELLKSLLAIFNSNLAKLWIWYNCPELMGGTREIRKVYFENFKIPMDNAAALQKLAALADQIITAKKNGEDTTELEAQVNTLVYQLYGITDPEEIASVENG